MRFHILMQDPIIYKIHTFNECKKCYPFWNFVNISEYCNGQTFTASCQTTEVIVMNHAEYGRMKLGNCIRQAMGYLGCSVDALNYFDGVCSNKNKCEMVVSQIPVSSPCPVDVTSYLEAGFHCEPGILSYRKYAMGVWIIALIYIYFVNQAYKLSNNMFWRYNDVLICDTKWVPWIFPTNQYSPHMSSPFICSATVWLRFKSNQDRQGFTDIQ